MSKPLVPDLRPAETLPMEEIRRSIGNAVWQTDAKRVSKEWTPMERGAIEKALEFFTADPEQRTMQNVHDVFVYLDFAFGGTATVDLAVPGTYDWQLLHKLSESQIHATFVLFYALIAHAHETSTDEQALFFGHFIARGLVEIGALFQLQQARTQRRKVAEKSHSRRPSHTAMDAVRAEFDRWQSRNVHYSNDADFARKMHARYAAAIANEGSIKNAVARWRGSP